MRTPMPWRDVEGGGFTDPAVRPWLPLSPTGECNVEDQRHSGDSVLSLTRDLIALRRQNAALRLGGYDTIDAPDGMWAWRRGEQFIVALNMSDEPLALDGVRGTIRLGTDRHRDGEKVDETLTLQGWEAVVVETT